MICPSESELLAFQLGELPSDQIQCVGEHLTACTKCEERTRTLDGSADTVLSALRQWSALRRGPSALRASHAPEPPGYEMLGLVGGGGMGLVYKARHLRLDRLVALKFLRAQGAAELARFEAEARAVARLQHPHIVQIFEVGQWQGQLFLALEFLDGGTLADHLAGKPQDPRASAQLVQTLARATHCAHTQSIVHRDLKPSNVLVSSKFKVPSSMSDPDKDNFDLGTSNVELKISDFGIAKHLHSTGQTRAEDILGTPGYMAPEQARGHSAVVGPASDIYSLGVILYEMLTGRVPLQGATDLETVLLVQTEEPLPPMRLRPGLPRDLETICLTCLRKEPSRRYASAEALADDLGRMLAGEPIAARPTPAWERAWKWGRRRPATAALIFLAAMVAGVGFPGATFLWVRADHARAQEADHRGKAQAAAQAETTAKRAAELSEGEALAAIDFLEKRIMIAARDKHNGGLGRQATLRQALDAALPQLDESFADQPLIEARLRRTMGLSFQSLGEYQSAAEQFTRARELYIAQRGWAHRDSIVNSISLASCYSKTRPAEAARLAEEALAIQRATPGANQLDLFWNMDELAEILFADPTRRAEAIKLREDVLALRKASFGPDHDDTLDSMDALARCYSSLDRHADAVRLREELLAQRRDGHAFDHPDTAEATRQLIEAYRSAGRGADAIRLGQEELAHYREKHGPDHTETLARLRTLAWLNAQEQQPEAVSLHEELLKLGTAKFGPDHEHTLAYMKILAESYAAFGRREESFALREQRLARQRARLGDEHGDTVDSRVMLAIAYRKLGRLDEEVKHLEALYPVRNTPAGSQHADSVLERLADRYARTGRRAEALPLREELLALRKTGLGPDHPTTLKTMSNVAGDLVALARGGEALPLVDECLQRSAATAMDWQLVSNLMVLRRRHFQQAKDPHGCRETAEMWERLNRTDPHSLYSAAKFRAVTAAVIRAADQSAASEAETIAQANIEADHAMDWLQQAVAAGFRNTGLMKFDAMDLDALCDREDFKRLVAGLEGERETGDARQGIEDGQ